MSLRVNYRIPINLTNTNAGALELLRSTAGDRANWEQYQSLFDRNRYSSGPLKDNWSIPNPIAILGNKLLSGAGSLLEKLGVGAANLGLRLQGAPQNLEYGASDVVLPSISDTSRLATIGKFSQVYGGEGASGEAAQATGAQAFFNSSTIRGHGTGEEALAAAGDALFGQEDALFKEMSALANSDDPKAQGKMLALQAKLQKIQRLISMITNMMMAGHETKKGVIQNLRV